MAEPTVMRSARTYPVTAQSAFRTVMTVPLEQIFNHWYGPIPPVREIRDQDGVWQTVGQTRTVALTGGGSMREELVRVDEPHAFGYRLTDLTGPLAALVSNIDGLWSFDPAGTGVRISWQWTVYATSGVAARALPVLHRLWRGYARHGFDRIEDLLLPA